MIWIEQLFNDEDLKSDIVKCPNCNKGRLCDKEIGEKATVLSIKPDRATQKSKLSVILKCPRCSSKFLVHIGKDDILS